MSNPDQLEIGRLREALKFYADGNHFIQHDSSAWDTISGEPQNFFEDEEGTAMVEDGSIAKHALDTGPAGVPADAELLQLAAMLDLGYIQGDKGGERLLNGAVDDADISTAVLEFGKAVLARWGAPTEAAAMAATVPDTLTDLFCQAMAWGAVYHPIVATSQWDKLRDDMAANFVKLASQAPVAGQPAEPSPAKTPGFESLRLWWVMHEAQWEMCDERPADDAVVLQFMGSGASHMVTAGQIRQALDVPAAPKGDSNG